MGIEYKIIVMGSMVMDLLIGTLFLFLVLVILHYLHIKRLMVCAPWEH